MYACTWWYYSFQCYLKNSTLTLPSPPYPPFFVFCLLFCVLVDVLFTYFYYRFCFLFITPWGWIENLLMPFKVTILPLFISLFEYFVFLYVYISNKYLDSVLWCLFVYVVMLIVMLLQVLHVDIFMVYMFQNLPTVFVYVSFLPVKLSMIT